MSKTEATLADLIIREGLRPNHKNKYVSPSRAREIMESRKFVLDADASSFLVDLDYQNFRGKNISYRKAIKTFEYTRKLARLPHALTWIEIDNIAHAKRLEEYDVTPKSDPGTLCERAGWHLGRAINTYGLGIRTPGDNVFWGEFYLDDGGVPAWAPFTFFWTTEDRPLPVEYRPNLGYIEALMGMTVDRMDAYAIYLTNKFGVLKNRPPHPGTDMEAIVKHALSRDGGAVLRQILTLLATINDIPAGTRTVVPSHGYYSHGGRYRRFVEHSYITLNLPKGRDPIKVARHIITLIRKRAHQVRGHWRKHHWRTG